MGSTLKKILLSLIAGCSITSAAFADNTATTNVTVSGQIIKALSLTIDESLRFGEVVVPQSGTTPLESTTEAAIAVTDPATGAFTISYLNNGSPDVSAPASPGTTTTHNRRIVGPGKITVRGEPNYYYKATSGFATGVPGGVNILVEPFEGSRPLNSSGDDVVYIGGTMSVARGVVPQEVNGTSTITVTYD